VVGASYIALECAGFLAGLGYETTVMARSIFLRSFDQEIAEMIVTYMTNHGTKFIRQAIPRRIEKLENGRLRVTWESTATGDTIPSSSSIGADQQEHKKDDDDDQNVDIYDTVLVAIGREPLSRTLSLDRVGIQLHPTTGKIIVDDEEQTNVSNIYAVGDIVSGKPELTPIAIQAGKLLARRLFAGSRELTLYDRVPTTVFTPLEYGCCGLSEEEAVARYQSANLEVYHSHFKPLEWAIPHREDNACFAKLICVKSENQRVVGLHILAPNAGEITQGYAVALRMNATKYDFEATIGIHPSVAEEIIRLRITKASGESAVVTGC
jgi:thioredoxin reductase (NADPH)